MSTATDRADADTLAYIGRNPGCKRTNGRCHANSSINVAAASRLIRAGLVAWPAGNGKLYLTEAGAELLWAPVPRSEHDYDDTYSDAEIRIHTQGGLALMTDFRDDPRLTAGTTVTITAWDDDDRTREITYRDATVLGVTGPGSYPWVTISAPDGAVLNDADTGEVVGALPPVAELNVPVASISRVGRAS